MAVTIIGAGIMGHSIALSFALSGEQVKLYDAYESSLEKAETKINEHIELLQLYDEALNKVGINQRIIYTTDLQQAVEGTQLIIEAVPEKLAIKEKLYQQLNELNNNDVIVASNTSTFSLEKLKKLYRYPEKICITHYFNPAHLVPLVEMVTAEEMSKEDISVVKNLLENSGKQAVLLQKDIDGFIANRLQAALFREAFFLVTDEVASYEDIDKVIKFGPGLRWALNGHFEIADFGGLDTWKSVMENLMPKLDNSIAIPADLLLKYNQGQLGTKSGRGFYDYSTIDLKDSERHREKKLIEMLKLKLQDI